MCYYLLCLKIPFYENVFWQKDLKKDNNPKMQSLKIGLLNAVWDWRFNLYIYIYTYMKCKS